MNNIDNKILITQLVSSYDSHSIDNIDEHDIIYFRSIENIVFIEKIIDHINMYFPLIKINEYSDKLTNLIFEKNSQKILDHNDLIEPVIDIMNDIINYFNINKKDLNKKIINEFKDHKYLILKIIVIKTFINIGDNLIDNDLLLDIIKKAINKIPQIFVYKKKSKCIIF